MATAEEVKEQLQRVTDAVGSVFFGKEEEIREILLGLVANGHVLLEDLPGTGKTTLAVAFSKVLSLDYRRVQFTPDLLPSDLTGFSVYDPERKEFVYREGAVFTNLLLADEINRTSTKTQAALLEVMEERQVTVEGTTRPLSAPFLVIGTQNPAGAVGTELLPEAEIDRFMISMSIGYPDEAAEVRMAEAVGAESPLKSLNSVLSQEDFLQVQEAAAGVTISDQVMAYLVRLVRTVRESENVEAGAGPRATISLVRMACASALADGRAFVIPEDVRDQALYVLRHRVRLSKAARAKDLSKEDVLQAIVDSVKAPAPGARK